jgi:hypothetical protein
MQLIKTKKSLLIIFLSLGLYNTAKSQGNLQYIDEKLVHFGFSLGFNALDFGITPSNQIIDGKIYQADVSNLIPGFSVGIISDLRLNRYLNLRFTPTLHFGERQLSYSCNGVKTNTLSLTSVPISVPIHLKYSAERKGNYRPYLLWGGGSYIDLGTNNDNPVLLRKLDFYTEFGVGCDLYFSFFKLAPELKFAVGFNNMLVPLDQRNAGFIADDDKKLSNALSKLTSNMLTLSFNFE